MSWDSKVGHVACAVLLMFGYTALAQRIALGPGGDKATVETRLMAANSEVQPLEIRLSIPAIDLEKQADGFDALQVPGLVPMGIAGNPDLFGTGTLIAVPDGYTPELSVTSETDRDFNGVLVAPAQRKFRCECDRAGSFTFNSALYRSRGTYPATTAELEEVGRMQGLHLMRVALHPVRLAPADKKLTVATSLVARVTFTRTERSEAAPLRLSSALYQIARNVTANGQGLGHTVAGTAPELLVIVVADSLKDSIKPLVDWKRAKGISVDVVTQSQAGAGNKAIKAYLQNYYKRAAVKPTYLLFVGNKDTMPTFMESTSSGQAASDWEYSLLNGSTHIPDVLYGRLAADNEADVAAQINRWIAYEKNPDNGASWYSEGTTIASDQGSSPSDKEYAQQIQAALKAGTYKSVDGFYQGEQTATASNISSALSEGRSWLTYIGHGSGTSWGSTNDTFDVDTVGSLTNANRLPIIIDVACLNGSWVKLNKCFGKAWVTQTTDNGDPAGAVSYYGGSVSVSWNEPAVMAVGIAKYHFSKPVTTLGGSVTAGQLYLVEQMGTGDNTLDNQKWYNLLGDPSLVVRTNTPAAYELKHSVRKAAHRLEIAISAVSPSGQGVPGVVASISQGSGNALAVARTDASGQATLSLGDASELQPNTVLTTTGYNLETHQVVLQ